MEPSIQPVTKHLGITSVSGDRRQREGSKQAFEEALDRQRKDAKEQTDQPAPDAPSGEDVVSLSHPSPPRPDAGLQQEPAAGRREDDDDRPHVDVVV